MNASSSLLTDSDDDTERKQLIGLYTILVRLKFILLKSNCALFISSIYFLFPHFVENEGVPQPQSDHGKLVLNHEPEVTVNTVAMDNLLSPGYQKNVAIALQSSSKVHLLMEGFPSAKINADANNDDKLQHVTLETSFSNVEKEIIAAETLKKRGRGRPKKETTLKENQGLYAPIIRHL